MDSGLVVSLRPVTCALSIGSYRILNSRQTQADALSIGSYRILSRGGTQERHTGAAQGRHSLHRGVAVQSVNRKLRTRT